MWTFKKIFLIEVWYLTSRLLFIHPGLEMSAKVYENQNSRTKEKVKYTIWTSPMDNCLSKILADYAKEGYRGENIIKSATYAAAVEALNEKFGLELNKEHVKNRLKTLKKQYAVLREILAQKGFKWDKTRKTVVANDATWKEYIKVELNAIDYLFIFCFTHFTIFLL